MCKKEVMELTGFGKRKLRYYVKIEKLNPLFDNGKQKYLREEVIGLLEEIKTFIDNNFSFIDACNLLGLNSESRNTVQNLIENNLLELVSEAPLKISDVANKRWISKISVHSFLERLGNEYVELNVAAKQVGWGRGYLSSKIPNNEKIQVGHKVYIPQEYLIDLDSGEKYYKINEVAEIFGKHPDRLRSRFFSNNAFKELFNDIITGTIWKINKQEVISYKKKIDAIDEKYYTNLEAKEVLSRNSSIANIKSIKSIKAPLYYKLLSPKKNIQRLYEKEDVHIFQKENKKVVHRIMNSKELNERLRNSLNDPYIAFKYEVDTLQFPSNLSETKELILSYAQDSFSSTKRNDTNMLAFIKAFFNMVKYLIESNLEKDFFYLDTTKIDSLLKDCPVKNYRKVLWSLLLFTEERRLCKYKTNKLTSPFSLSLVEKKEKVVLSFDELISVYEYCKNTNIHIEKALKDKEYASIWLFTMILLTNAWRPSDVFRIPPIKPELIGIRSMNWFESNQLTLPNAQKIINVIHSLHLVTSKTGVPRDFTCNISLVVPMTTAICICEFHRRETSNIPCLIDFTNENRKHNRVTTGDFTKFFGECEELKDVKFSGLIANRSVMEHLYYSILEKKGKGNSIFELMMQFRKHKTDVTKEYIGGNNDKTVLQLFDRGEFGYIYERMIELITETNEKSIEKTTTMTERTAEIVRLKSFFNPIEIENFSLFISKICNEEEETLLSKFLTLTPDEAFEYCRKLYLGEMPSKKADVHCLIYPECHRPSDRYNCSTCPFAVHTVYALTSLFEEFDNSCKTFRAATKNGIKKREKSIILKLLDVIFRAIEKYGKEYVFSFYLGDGGEEGFENSLIELGG